MHNLNKALIFGFFVWFFPFSVSVLFCCLHKNETQLYNSVFALSIAITGIIFSYFYFKKVNENYIKEGIFLALIFFVFSIFLDLLMYSWGPMKMSHASFLKNISIGYFVYFPIGIGFGYLLKNRRRKANK